MVSFIVFTSPRSGSSWLLDLLDSHPQIAAYAELFLPGDRTAPNYGSRDVQRFETKLAPGRPSGGWRLVPRRLAYLRRLFAVRPGVGAIGFKLMYEHPPAHPGVLPYLAVRRTRVVHLVRTNSLDQVVSWETATARGLFRVHAGEDVPPVRVRLDAATLATRLEKMAQATARARRTLDRYRLPALELTYEQLLHDPKATADLVAQFLGIKADMWQPASTLIPMNTAPRQDVIDNLGEVESALAGTQFSWMLGPGSDQRRLGHG